MRPVAPQEIAEKIVNKFIRTSSKKVYEAIIDILRAEGFADIEAIELAENSESQVLSHLLNYPLLNYHLSFLPAKEIG